MVLLSKSLCAGLILLLLVTGVMPAALGAGIEIGGGRTSCNDVKRQITKDWFDLKRFFRPDETGVKRPKSRDFFCVSPAHTYNAVPKHSSSLNLKCFTSQGQRFCCDAKLAECAGF